MKKIFFIFAFCVGLFAADATTTIINQGISLPKIIVQDASNLSDSAFEQKFFKLMVGDLKVGATFEVSDQYHKSSFEGDYTTNLGQEGSPALIVRYEVGNNTSSPLPLKVKVLNGKDGSIVYDKTFSINDTSKYPFLAHTAVSEIVKELGYSNVDWMKNMIIFSRYTSSKIAEILIADYTLSYQKVLLGGGLNIFPKWANANQSAFYYTYYENGVVPALYRYDLSSGSKTKIVTGKGMLIASDVSKDGQKLLLTNAPQDQADIFLYNLGSKTMSRITDYPGIDVNGNFVDNDSRVVFVSDRLGYPNIFAQGIHGGSVQQMVFHGKNNSSLSTHDNYIVYSSRESGGGFNIYLMSTQSDYVRQLTANGKNLFPRFSSDGGSVVYIKDSGGQSAVGIIRVNENKSFQFPLKIGKIQSVDW